MNEGRPGGQLTSDDGMLKKVTNRRHRYVAQSAESKQMTACLQSGSRLSPEIVRSINYREILPKEQDARHTGLTFASRTRN